MKLNGIFKDDMIFQRDREIRVFGEALGAETVSGVLKDAKGNIIVQESTNEIFEDGFFLLIMPPTRAGGPYTLEITLDDFSFPDAVLNNVYVGEVWLAAGQSNMEYPLGRSEFARRVIADVPDTKIHFYDIPVAGNYDQDQAMKEDQSKWVVINKDNCYDMSAVAFYFARKIETFLEEHHVEGKELHIGIVGCYLGGTSMASWQTVESLESTPEGRRYVEMFDEEVKALPPKFRQAAMDQYNRDLDVYYEKMKALLEKNPYITYIDAEKKSGLTIPWPPPSTPESIRRPGALFNTMVLRIVPFALRGVILYQGETDADDHADEYAPVFTSMINEWRESFWDEKLPFLFCQLPMYTSRDLKYMGFDDMKWPKLREQQALVAKTVPDTYMAVLTDCGEFDNLHPVDKKTPGERLALLALHHVYGYESLPATAPYVVDVRRGEGVEVTFGGDFKQLNLLSAYSSSESGFELAGDDGVFYPAEASVDFDGKTVVITCSEVEWPKSVRYAYFSYGTANLVTDNGLAAAPFQAVIDRSIGTSY